MCAANCHCISSGDPLRSAFVRLGFICVLFLAALSSGYALSSSVGQGAVRREAETQFARLLKGRVKIERADLRIRDGFWIEGRNVRVYPSPSGPGLSSDHVSVRIDILALMTGRFRVQDLVLDGIQLDIERSVADRWGPYPINAIDKRGGPSDNDDLERKLGAFRVIDVITRVLLERPFIAQRIKVSRGRVRLIDRYVRGQGEAPFMVQIDGINGSLVHDWIGNSANLVLAGSLSDANRQDVPIEVSGERRTDGSMNLSVAITKLELESYRDYFQNQTEEARRARASGTPSAIDRPFEGLLSGVVRFETPELEHGVLEIDWLGRDVALGVPRANEVISVNAPRLNLRTRVEVHPGRVRISEAGLTGPDIRVVVSGDIERPLRESSPANLAVHFHDVGVGALNRIARALPQQGREPLLRGLSSIETGKIVRVGGSGTQRLSVWQAVLRGERLDHLPTGLSMLAEVSGVTIAFGEHERLSALSATAVWTRDRLRITRLRALRDGVLTPQVNITVEGFPILFDQSETFDQSLVSNASLPGLSLLNQVFAQSPEVEGENVVVTDRPVEVQLDIDYLQHSALIWPLRNAEIDAVFKKRGQSFRIVRGTWGGAHVTGDLLLTHDPDSTLDAQLNVSLAPPASDNDGFIQPEATPMPADSNAKQAWASGNFVIDGMHGKHWPVGQTVARFAFFGDELKLGDVRGRLVPIGTLEGNLSVDLESPEALAFDTQFKIRGGDAGRLLEAVGFPDGFASGTFDIDGDLGGPILPDETAFALVAGKLEINGSDGEVRQSIPLVASLAHAAEGLSPARASDALAYETINTVIEFQRGRIATDEIKLDGPLRLFISGTFDFARPERAIDGEIGIFLFRQVDQLLGSVPLLGNLIPGGKGRGLFGVFFDVDGTLEEPVLTALPMKSLTDGIPVPDLIKAPFSAIRQALQSKSKKR